MSDQTALNRSGKIALFFPSLRGGGAERVMMNLARGFAEQGLKVDMVLASRESAHASNLRGRLMLLLVRRFYLWAAAVVAVSKDVAEDLIRLTGLPKEKVRVIYNPVVVPELFELAKEPVEHRWFRAGEPPVVLSVGRLTAQKDYPTLLRVQ